MNAIEAMSSAEPRVLSIKSEVTEHDTVHVLIQDTGSGIDPSNLDRVFKPLFTTKARGMGMGAIHLPLDHREPQWSDLGVRWRVQRLDFPIRITQQRPTRKPDAKRGQRTRRGRRCYPSLTFAGVPGAAESLGHELKALSRWTCPFRSVLTADSNKPSRLAG
jgi:hypothetical protein